MCVGPEIALIAAGLQAGQQVMAGRAESAALKAQALEQREQAEMAKLDATNRALQRLTEADRVHRANIAQAAANGILPYSASTRNLLAVDKKIADRDISLIKLGGRFQKNSLENQANQNMSAGRTAFTSSLFSAAGTIAGAGVDYAQARDLTIKPTKIPGSSKRIVPPSPRTRSLS